MQFTIFVALCGAVGVFLIWVGLAREFVARRQPVPARVDRDADDDLQGWDPRMPGIH